MRRTSAHAGTTATRLWRTLLATLAIVVLSTAAVPAVAETPSPTPSSSGAVTASLAAPAGGALQPGAPLTATLGIRNTTTTATTAGSGTLTLGTQPLGDRAALQAWLSGGAAPDGVDVATADVPQVAGGGSGTASFTVPADNPALAGRAAGVYPLWASAGRLTARSVVVFPSGATPTVGVVVPITAGARSEALLSESELATLTGTDGDLTAQLDAVAGSSAILAIDPSVPASIRALGTLAPASARAWLERLQNLPNDRFGLQFGDADVSAQLAAGTGAPLQPTSLSAFLDQTHFPTEPTPAPSASTEPAASVPDLATLLDVGGPAVYWPPTGTTSPAIVGTLAAQGALTLVASTATGAGTGGGTVTAHAVSAEGANVLVYDTAISAALRDAADASDPTARAASLSTAAAHLSFATTESAGQPLLVVIDRGTARDHAGLRAAIAQMTSGVTATSLAGLAAAPPQSVTLTEGAVDSERTDAVQLLLQGATQIESFATVLADPTLLTGTERAATLQLLGGGWLSAPDAWRTAMATHEQNTAATLSAVSIVPPTSVNLLTADTALPLWIHNGLPYPVNVTLFAAPDSLKLTVEGQTTVVASAGSAAGPSNTSVKVPVRARIANGEVRIALSLKSPSGVAIGSSESLEVNVRADWEKVGMALLAVLVGGFLTVGVIRTVRRRRRAAAARSASGDAS